MTAETVRQQYATIRTGVAARKPIAVLHISAERTAIALGGGAEPDAVLLLQIGSRKTAAKYFQHDPPTPDEMENAITAVEDALMPVRDTIPAGSGLHTADAGIREIALVAGLVDKPKLTLTRDAVEATFNRLASVAMGRPASQEGLPEGGAFAARLLILRECMHHAGFEAIAVRG